MTDILYWKSTLSRALLNFNWLGALTPRRDRFVTKQLNIDNSHRQCVYCDVMRAVYPVLDVMYARHPVTAARHFALVEAFAHVSSAIGFVMDVPAT